MNKKIFWLIWSLILILAIGVRVYKLGELPYGFHVDEIKAGWNAWSMLKTGFDDRGNRLALYYNSFGDFRPTGIFYLIMPALLLLGKSVLATRLMPALIGALTIWPVGLLIGEMAAKNKERMMLAGMLLMALNPWHIDVSRATSEVVVSIFWGLWGLLFFIKLTKSNKWSDLIKSILFMVLGYLFYHTIRVLAPMMMVVATGFCYQQIKQNRSGLKVMIAVVGVILITLLMMIQKEARGRLGQVSILNDDKAGIELRLMPVQEGENKVLVARIFHNKIVVYGKIVLNDYLEYFSGGFLVGSDARPLRYQVNGFGLITYIEIILMAAGLMAWGRKKEVGWWWLMLILAPIPAAVTVEDIPNMHRALFMVPFMVGIEVYGLELLWEFKKWGKLLTGAVAGGWIINLVYFGHLYLSHSQFGESSYYRDGGNVELTETIMENQNNFDKIVLPNYPDEMYPWIAYLGNKDPTSFNRAAIKRDGGDWSYENMIFSKQHCPSAKMINEGFPTGKVLVVDAEGCEIKKTDIEKYGLKLVQTIKRPDGSPPYFLWEKDPTVALLK